MGPWELISNVVLTLAVAAGFALRDRPRILRAVFVGLGVIGFFYFALAGVWVPCHRHGVDFNQYLVGATELLRGRDPYADYAEFIVTREGPIAEIQNELGLTAVPPVSYPPLFYIALSPLLLLPVNAAFAVWTVGNAALWALAVYLTCIALGLTRPVTVGAVLGLSFLSNPVIDNMYLGQSNVVVAFFLAAAFYALTRQRRLAGGALTAAAILIKVFPAVVVLWFALRRRWREVLIATGTCVAAVAVTAAIWGPLIWVNYFRYIILPAMSGPITMAVNIAVATTPARFVPPASAATPALVWLGKAGALAALAASMWLLRRSRLDPTGEFSFVVISGLIANNWLTAPYLTAALPAFIYLGRRIFARVIGGVPTALAAASFLALAWRFDYRGLRAWPTTPLLSLKPLGLLALWVAFIMVMERRPVCKAARGI